MACGTFRRQEGFQNKLMESIGGFISTRCTPVNCIFPEMACPWNPFPNISSEHPLNSLFDYATVTPPPPKKNVTPVVYETVHVYVRADSATIVAYMYVHAWYGYEHSLSSPQGVDKPPIVTAGNYKPLVLFQWWCPSKFEKLVRC